MREMTRKMILIIAMKIKTVEKIIKTIIATMTNNKNGENEVKRTISSQKNKNKS